MIVHICLEFPIDILIFSGAKYLVNPCVKEHFWSPNWNFHLNEPGARNHIFPQLLMLFLERTSVCARREARHFSQQITQSASWPQKFRGKGVRCNHFSSLWLLNPLSFLPPSNHNCRLERRCRRHGVSQLPCLFVSWLILPWWMPNVCVCARVCVWTRGREPTL